MGKSISGETLSLHTRKEIVAEIATRGAALNLKKGTFAALIFEKWFADGCPAVTPADEAMQTLKLGGIAAERRQSPYIASKKKLA